MVENSAIEWTDHTFNPWIGCTVISAGCTNCYAKVRDNRFGGDHWGPRADRRLVKDWSKPPRWNRAAAAMGVRQRVFCASMADIFDDHPSILPEWRLRLWDLIEATPHLDWQLLTKRPSSILPLIPRHWRDYLPRNVWIGCSVINQAEADHNVPILLQVPAAIYFLSLEPLLGPLHVPEPFLKLEHRGWIIVGGESGSGARYLLPEWVRGPRDQCAAAGVPFLFKQWGEWAPIEEVGEGEPILRGGRDRHSDRIVYLGDQTMLRVGKRIAGRTIDGTIHHAFPSLR